jgi:hypothetical protein
MILGCGLKANACSGATGTVQLTLMGDPRGSAVILQEWGQALGKAGIQNVRIETTTDFSEPAIDIRGSSDRPVYMVTGIIKSRDELILPGARFKRSEIGQLAQWLNELAEQGPPDRREPKDAMGLTESQLRSVCEKLATRVDFTTSGQPADQVAEKIAAKLTPPLKIDANVMHALTNEKVTEDLNEFSSGTALAYVLKLAGYGITPKISKGTITFSVAKVQANTETWPVGIPVGKRDRELAPALFEFRNVNVQNVSAADALKAIAERLKIPTLMDHKALAKLDIDPAKVKVSHPQAQTTYSVALRKLLFQAKLKYELRCDEADRPFLWITTLKGG